MNKKRIALILLLLCFPIIVLGESQLPVGVVKLIEYQRQLSLSINFLISFLAGIISITSPCGFAILPTYFAIAFKDKNKTMLTAISFSIGMLIAFIIFGFVAGLFGSFLNQYKLLFAEISGYLLIFFGIMLLLNKGFSIFNFKIDANNNKDLFGTAFIGFLFGVSWTPCVGPILLGILVLATNTGSTLQGTLNLLFYGLGVIIPLLIIAYLSDRYNISAKKFFRGKIFSLNKNFQIHSYNLIGGMLLIIVGVLIVLYKGTFFFQTTMTNYIPWSMSAWGYFNEIMLNSRILTSKIGNLVGIFILGIIILIVYRIVRKHK